MVLVLFGGEIRQQMFNLIEPATQDQLSQAANHITHLAQGLDAAGLSTLTGQLNSLEQEVVELILQDLMQASLMIAGDVYMDGLTNVLAEPEFSTSEDARRALRLLEERSMLEDLLSRTVLSTSGPGGVGVQVLIGGEGTWKDLRQVSLVLARYGVPGMATGTLGVLGPMRMPYGRAISTVRFVAGLLSDFINETLVD
jgi:heat-inducible transcriptional repressor